ncbi:SDR family NAD(P)-dependent oxidoreductase [candidate division KSB1 bacterium]|nr:SDR family NAD(P)-dependent oxidoreductase [candidate division KSB1 bacterium]NIR68879.1 SDR family NAD(P)-dependent oxidoreductase [candidate division KSB1 bacterium]NIS27247.1 SDR family NAD(P)-dependent oxidoreductase [candidate division KSB1 bacterium]NIT74132.1 SDR family NAD(P)-dependent oxidoreductase [candidate division KSB1 bacterium]NIU27981.1 SDR family NAD(P)-dependent oxidoreductase [candidate division KSB1 bacterium]
MNQDLHSYWTGKSVLITGASSGLGYAVTEALASYKIKFGLLSRRQERMQELADKLQETGSSFWIKSCDVRNRDEVLSSVKEFHQKAGSLDVAWINSGISLDSSFRKWDWEAFESSIDTNLKGAIYTIRACLEIMVPQGSGAIVGIGSAASMRGLPTRGVYSLTKVGLDYFLQSKAAELPQIQFTVIHPGFVDTPINESNPNRFWLLTPEKAARIMIKAVAKRKRQLIYPLRMNLLFHMIRLLPLPFYYWLANKTMKLSQPSKT